MTESGEHGVVAAGHPVTAAAGADVLRGGGNAVDAAVASLLASLTAEPMLTGLGGGGYMLVVTPGGERTLIDFFVEAPGRGVPPAERVPLVPVVVSFGDADQVFNIGPASVGAPGMPAGVCRAVERFGSLPLADLVAPGAALAREGVVLNEHQSYVLEILAKIATATPECASLHAPGGRVLSTGDTFRNPELGDTLERLGRDGVEPFSRGDIAAAIADYVGPRGGVLTSEDIAAYDAIERAPVAIGYRGRTVVTNPPPSAGGTLIAFALAQLERAADAPDAGAIVAAMRAAQAERTDGFLAGLAQQDFLEEFLASRLGSTTHLSVIDADGLACGVTTSNGEGAGILVPGTGIHVNNMLGEEDLNPFGFHRHPPGRRLPSMMAPTAVLDGGRPRLVLGSGGSNRIRSAILQTVVNVIDHGMDVDAAVGAPRLHFEDDVVHFEPGIDTAPLQDEGVALVPFRDRNLYFGGVNAVERDPGTGELRGGGDPRRGGAAAGG